MAVIYLVHITHEIGFSIPLFCKDEWFEFILTPYVYQLISSLPNIQMFICS